MWWSVILLLSCSYICYAEEVTETEMFFIGITPKMFNWTYQEFDKQYVYHPSLITKPDLPNWLHYVYSIRHQSGFVYGTPALGQTDIDLEVVALNKEDYETRRLVVPINIKKKNNVATHHVQLKIDNLNVEDLLDEYRMDKLKEIFRKKLWKESGDELHATFMASAIEMGARLPLIPNEGEGVVLKLGSHKNWSTELILLQEEVRPLSKMSQCPRNFKRTTVERLFRDAGFNLDWCTFKLVKDPILYQVSDMDSNHLRLPPDPSLISYMWFPTKAMVPRRTYSREFAITFILPILIMSFMVSVMVYAFFFNRRFAARMARKGNSVAYQSHMSGMTLTNTGTSDALLGDNISEKIVSPNNTLKPRSDVEVDYNRPQPPPYLGSNTNTLVQRHKPTAEEELLANRAHSLEESLQILNDANISNRTHYRVDDILYPERVLKGDLLVIDNIGGNAVDEDYVLIKPENEASSLRPNFKNDNFNNGNVKGYGNKI